MKPKTNRIGARQIHLDFHTSELIENVGARFDPEEFARTLKDAHVDSITLFTRGHHGNLYYDSKLFPEYVHPHLADRQLLEHQAEACHRHGIDVNLYTTVYWDKRIADEHIDWICIDENGALQDYKGKGFFEAGFYKNLCVNTPYRDYLKAQFEEALRAIPAEGAWYDAAFITECCCPACQAKMKKLGLDPAQKADREKFSLITYKDMVDDLSALVCRVNPAYNIFYNKGHVGVREKAVQDGYTYYAFESLPGGEWGYMDFPVSAHYSRNFGKECLGMTGRFHTEWGDFHAFRNKHALEFECYSMLVNGCKCIIGDQMDPSGKLNPWMYQQIGEVYADVERKEPWCQNAVPVVEIGLFTEEEFAGSVAAGYIPRATEGAARLLQELAFQYDIIDSESDFSRYRLLILPDTIPVNESFAQRLQDFVAGGGRLLATYKAGLAPDGAAFAVNLGVVYQGDAPYWPDFILPEGDLGQNLYPSEYVMYLRGAQVGLAPDGAAALWRVLPVFNREYGHFCSHLHSPSSGKKGGPAAVKSPAGLYFAHPLFTQYQHNAPPWCKTLFANAVHALVTDPILRHNGPATLITSVMEQPDQNRRVLHLLHYIPQRKSDTMDIVDDRIPLHELAIELQAPRPVQAVRCVPQDEAIPFEVREGAVRFRVPKVDGHQMVAIEFE